MADAPDPDPADDRDDRRGDDRADDHADEYRVGYGKPPMHSRYQPGQTGNPSGRPKKPKSVDMMVLDAARARVAIKEDGETVLRPKMEVGIIQLFNRAAMGKQEALELALKLYGRAEMSEFISNARREEEALEHERRLEMYRLMQEESSKDDDTDSLDDSSIKRPPKS